MAETLTVNTDESTPELTAEEQDSLKVGEQMAEEQGKLLAGKYKNAEDLEKAYVELQKKLGEKDGVSQEGQETQEVEAKEESEESPQYLEDGSVNYEMVSEEYGAEVSSIFKSKGIDPWAISNHFHENNGTISEDMYSQLEGAGFSKQLVDAYLDGRAVESGYKSANAESDLAQKEIDKIQNSVGGEAEYRKITDWAGKNLTKAEVDSFDKVISTGDSNVIQMAVAGLKSRYEEANGYEGRMLTGKQTSSSDVFRSQAQLVQAMADPRYENDPAYRADVVEKLERSDLKF